MPNRPPPDPDVIARLARLGVSLGTAGLRERDPRDPDVAPDPEGPAAASPGEPGHTMPRTPWTPARRRARPAEAGDPWDDDPADAEMDWDVSLDAAPIEHVLTGEIASGIHGSCFVHAARRSVDDGYGGQPLGKALEACTASLAELSGHAHLAEMDLARTAFVDTETTGLSGGAGTFAFLIGIGRFVGDAFEVRQFFMRDPGEERAQLAEAGDWAAGCTSLVTFNGRSFDVPLLNTRYTLHRQPLPLPAGHHLDLLPPARRLWRRRLTSCALQSLERNILGFEREGDVPGWLIPYRYNDYQRTGNARPLHPVFEHNQLDILSMVALVARLADAWRAPESALSHGEDWLSLARTFEARGEWDRVVRACADALACGLAVADADQAQFHLSMAAKRLGDWDRAVAVWRAQTALHPPRRLFPFEELAKYWEHRAPEPDAGKALDYAVRARSFVDNGTVRPRRGRGQALADLDHRIERLRRKAG